MSELICVIESVDLEVELVDVPLVERRQRAEHDLAVRADLVLAQPAGGERLARLAGDASGDERRGGLAGEVADVLGHPELELVDGPVLHELAHLVREPQPGQLHLALLRRGGQVARGRRDAHRGRRDDALEVRIRREQALRLLEGLLVVVVAVGDLHELDVLVLRLLERVLHHLDPGVLVRRVRRGRQDRDLPLVADLLGDRLDLVLADQLRRDLVDDHAARVGRDVGVHRHDLDPPLSGLLERGRHGVRVVAGDDDRGRLLLRDRVDERHLRRRAGVGRALDAVAAAELLQRLGDAGVLELLVRVAELLGDRDRLEALGDRRVGIDAGIAGRGLAARAAGAARARAGVVLRLAARGGEEGQRGDHHGCQQPAIGGRRGHAFSSCGGFRCAAERDGHTPRCRDECARAARARVTRLGPSTEPMSRAPVTIWIQYDEIDSLSSSAFWMPPSRSRARMTPPIVPRPPKIDTPPSSTAVTTVSSKPTPTLAAAVELRSEMTTPASAATAPESTNSASLMRLTRRPEKNAASSLAPIAKTERPKGVKCSSTAKRTARIANRTMTFGTAVPAKLPIARSVQSEGKSVTESSPMTTNARPRNSASVPIVTASDSRPSRVTSRPLNAPHSPPATMQIGMISPSGRPPFHSAAMSALDSPSTEAIDRSISAAITTRVNGSAMSAISEKSSEPVVNESLVRNSGEIACPIGSRSTNSATSSVSQRPSRPRHVPASLRSKPRSASGAAALASPASGGTADVVEAAGTADAPSAQAGRGGGARAGGGGGRRRAGRRGGRRRSRRAAARRRRPAARTHRPSGRSATT